jgi:hypothetical protein
MVFFSMDKTYGHFDRSEPLALSEVEGVANGVEKSGLAVQLYADSSTRPRFCLRQKTQGLARNDITNYGTKAFS